MARRGGHGNPRRAQRLHPSAAGADREFVSNIVGDCGDADVYRKRGRDGGAESAGQVSRRRSDRLDRVVDLLGELVITKGRFQSLVDSITPEISEQFQIFDNTISTIQDTVMGLRMVNLSQIFDTYPRTVRDIAHSRGMEIELLLQGTHILIDRSVVDQVNEALLHLVRNAAIHGIEDESIRRSSGKSSKGVIRLAARRERGEVIFEVEDDGSGLDIDKIRQKGIDQGLITQNTVLSRTQLAALIFQHGFSTADEVTEIAGRGIGMEIVKSTLEEISGTVEIRTKSKVGTRFIIRVPQTLAIIEGLIVMIGRHTFAIPLLNVEKIFSINDPAIELHENRRYLNWDGSNIRIMDLEREVGEIIGLDESASKAEEERGEKIEVLRKKIIKGEGSTGDSIKDFTIVTQRTISEEAEKPYRDLQKILKGKEGEQVFVARVQKRNRPHAGSTFETLMYLGVLDSDKLEFDFGHEESLGFDLNLEREAYKELLDIENKIPSVILPTLKYAIKKTSIIGEIGTTSNQTWELKWKSEGENIKINFHELSKKLNNKYYLGLIKYVWKLKLFYVV